MSCTGKWFVKPVFLMTLSYSNTWELENATVSVNDAPQFQLYTCRYLDLLRHTSDSKELPISVKLDAGYDTAVAKVASSRNYYDSIHKFELWVQ
jgi:hypothetical protein